MAPGDPHVCGRLVRVFVGVGTCRYDSAAIRSPVVEHQPDNIPAGYLSFYGDTKANILENFPDDNVIISIARVLFAVTMFLTYPLELFVCRDILEELYCRLKDTRRGKALRLSRTGDRHRWHRMENGDDSGSLGNHAADELSDFNDVKGDMHGLASGALADASAEEQHGTPGVASSSQSISSLTPLPRHLAWTFSLLVLSGAVAASTDDLGPVLAIVGDFGASALAYILPGACHAKLTGGGRSMFRWQAAPSLALAAFGCVILVVGTTTTIITLVV